MFRTLLVAALALTTIPLAAGLAASADPVPLAATHVVRAFNFGYEDQTSGTFVTEAAVGDVVRFVFESRHSATAGVAGAGLPVPGPNSGLLAAGNSYDYTVTTSGMIVYTCILHASMNGVIDAS